MRCPCCANNEYDQCCMPFIENNLNPATALELMRSRFTAYALKKHEYIMKTWYEKTRPQSFHDPEEIQWDRLEIINTRKGTAKDNKGEVHFIAYYQKYGKPSKMEECSKFIKQSSKWYYVDAKTPTLDHNKIAKTGRNTPCPCGSGKKYKHCCG